MTRVILYKDREGTPRGFKVSGHAGYAESGYDIVCAAVSALTLNAINSISELTDDGFTGSQNEKSGSIDFKLEATPSSDTILLLKSYELGIRSIEEEYGHKFLKFEIREV